MLSGFLFYEQRKKILNYNLSLDIFSAVSFNQVSQRNRKPNTALNHFTILFEVLLFFFLSSNV